MAGKTTEASAKMKENKPVAVREVCESTAPLSRLLLSLLPCVELQFVPERLSNPRPAAQWKGSGGRDMGP